MDRPRYDEIKIRNRKQKEAMAKKGDFMMIYSTLKDTRSRRYKKGSPLSCEKANR